MMRGLATKWTPLQASLDEAHCPPESIMSTLLQFFWQYECEVVPVQHHRTQRKGWKILHTGKNGRRSYLRVRDDSYYWDHDGETFRTPELALLAIVNAEAPQGGPAPMTYGKNPATYPWWVKEIEERRGAPLPRNGDKSGLNRRSSDVADQILSKLIMMLPHDDKALASEIAQAFATQKPQIHKILLDALVETHAEGVGKSINAPGPTAPDYIPPFVPAGA